MQNAVAQLQTNQVTLLLLETTVMFECFERKLDLLAEAVSIQPW